MEPSQLVRLLRSRSGLGLRALARRAGTSHPTLHAYEAGDVEPRFTTLRRVAAAAGYDIQLTLTRRADRGDREARGQELAEVLALAAEFPARRRGPLRAPVFGRTAS